MTKSDNRLRAGIAVSALLVGVLATAPGAQAGDHQQRQTHAPTTDGAARPAPIDNWVTYHHDLNRQGYNPLAKPASLKCDTATPRAAWAEPGFWANSFSRTSRLRL